MQKYKKAEQSSAFLCFVFADRDISVLKFLSLSRFSRHQLKTSVHELVYKVFYFDYRFNSAYVGTAEEETVFPVALIGAYQSVGDAEGLVLKAAEAM